MCWDSVEKRIAITLWLSILLFDYCSQYPRDLPPDALCSPLDRLAVGAKKERRVRVEKVLRRRSPATGLSALIMMPWRWPSSPLPSQPGASILLEGYPGQHGPPGGQVQDHASCEELCACCSRGVDVCDPPHWYVWTSPQAKCHGGVDTAGLLAWRVPSVVYFLVWSRVYVVRHVRATWSANLWCVFCFLSLLCVSGVLPVDARHVRIMRTFPAGYPQGEFVGKKMRYLG